MIPGKPDIVCSRRPDCKLQIRRVRFSPPELRVQFSPPSVENEIYLISIVLMGNKSVIQTAISNLTKEVTRRHQLPVIALNVYYNYLHMSIQILSHIGDGPKD